MKAICPTAICPRATYSRNLMPQVNPFSVVRPREGCSVSIKGILLAELIFLCANWPPHPTPKGWGGQLAHALLVLRQAIGIGYPWARGVSDVILKEIRGANFRTRPREGCCPLGFRQIEWWRFMTCASDQPLFSCETT